MNELAELSRQLPDTIEDLAKFALIGREKLVAVRAEIRAIDKVGLAQKVHRQKLEEAQEIASAVLDAEVKLGSLIGEIPKATGRINSPQSKAGILENAGIPIYTACRLQNIARHPEAVEQAKQWAKENNEIVTRKDVERIIREQQKPNNIVETVKERVKERQKQIESSFAPNRQTLDEQKTDQLFLKSNETYKIWNEFKQICRELDKTCKKFDEFMKIDKGDLRTALLEAGIWGLRREYDFAENSLKYNYEILTKATNEIGIIISEVTTNGIQPER